MLRHSGQKLLIDKPDDLKASGATDYGRGGMLYEPGAVVGG